MEPKDILFDQAILGINRKSGLGISSRHNQYADLLYHEIGACVAFVDSSGGFLAKDLSGEMIASLLTVSGGQKILQGVLDARRLDWPRCITILVLIVSVLLLGAEFWGQRSFGVTHNLAGGTDERD